MWKSIVTYFHISQVGLSEWNHTTRYSKFPWLRNRLKLINNKNTSPIRCFDQVFLYSMVFHVKIGTRIASNNTISWSVTNEILTYFRRELEFASQIHVSWSACLDDYCPYLCLNPCLNEMVVHRTTYVLMIFLSKIFICKRSQYAPYRHVKICCGIFTYVLMMCFM